MTASAKIDALTKQVSILTQELEQQKQKLLALRIAYNNHTHEWRETAISPLKKQSYITVMESNIPTEFCKIYAHQTDGAEEPSKTLNCVPPPNPTQ